MANELPEGARAIIKISYDNGERPARRLIPTPSVAPKFIGKIERAFDPFGPSYTLASEGIEPIQVEAETHDECVAALTEAIAARGWTDRVFWPKTEEEKQAAFALEMEADEGRFS